MNPPQISSPLQFNLVAPATSFARHRNYSYASSQELVASTHQIYFHLWKEIEGGFND